MIIQNVHKKIEKIIRYGNTSRYTIPELVEKFLATTGLSEPEINQIMYSYFLEV